MPSAFYDERRGSWIAVLHGLWQTKKERTRIRVPPARIIAAETAKQDAKAYADECERYCRLIESRPQAQYIQHALQLGCITEAQATALLKGQAVDPKQRLEPLTLRAAALSHPSSSRDDLPTQARYLRALDDFQSFAGIEYSEQLTLDHVLRWVVDLRARGWAWDSRRHALIYLRRAALMATRSGIPDVLAGIRLDHRERRSRPIQVWSIKDLIAEIQATTDHRIRAAIALGGCLGMRPTEILRANVEDLDGDVIHIGRGTAKTDASVRSLPIPEPVLPWIKSAIAKRKTGAIVQPIGPRADNHLTLSGLHQLLADTLNKRQPAIGPKDLRKTFATWASKVIPASDLERYLGHETALHAAVTGRHYLAAHSIDELRPSAKLLAQTISTNRVT